MFQEYCKEHPEKTIQVSQERFLEGTGPAQGHGALLFSSSVWSASSWQLSSVLLGLEWP